MKGLNATCISVPVLQSFLVLNNIVETLITTKSFHTQFYIILLAGKFAGSNRRNQQGENTWQDAKRGSGKLGSLCKGSSSFRITPTHSQRRHEQ